MLWQNDRCEKKIILWLYDDKNIKVRKRILDDDFKKLITLYPEEAKWIDKGRYDQWVDVDQSNNDDQLLNYLYTICFGEMISCLSY